MMEDLYMSSPAGTPIKPNKVLAADLITGTSTALIALQANTNTVTIYAPEAGVNVFIRFGDENVTLAADGSDAHGIIQACLVRPNARRGWRTDDQPGVNTHVVVRTDGAATVDVWVEEYNA